MKNLTIFFSILLIIVGCTFKEVDRIYLMFGESPFSADSIFNKQTTKLVTYKGRKFSGIAVEKYGNGQAMYRMNFKNGLANGLSEEFYTNGTTKSKCTYKNGRGIGEYIEYYENGNLKISSILNENGKADGIGTYYSENGKKIESMTFKNGVQDGPYIEFFSDGTVRRKVNYNNGKKNGIAETYYENGKLQSKIAFSDNKMNGEFSIMNEDGTLIKGFYKDDKLDGVVKQYSKDGKLVTQTTYVTGKRQSPTNSSTAQVRNTSSTYGRQASITVKDVTGKYQFELNRMSNYIIHVFDNGSVIGSTVPKNESDQRRSADDGTWSIVSANQIEIYWEDIPKWRCTVRKNSEGQIIGIVDENGEFIIKISSSSW